MAAWLLAIPLLNLFLPISLRESDLLHVFVHPIYLPAIIFVLAAWLFPSYCFSILGIFNSYAFELAYAMMQRNQRLGHGSLLEQSLDGRSVAFLLLLAITSTVLFVVFVKKRIYSLTRSYPT
ncbi:MAG: hypothetical protein AAF328_07320 [Planctomycetota bacterium]